jgi:hypothetical protein
VKFFNRKFLRLLRRSVRARARLVPSIWKEYKRRRRAEYFSRTNFPSRVQKYYWLVAIAVLFPVFAQRSDAPIFLPLAALYCSVVVFLRARNLHLRLYASAELVVSFHYPVSNEQFLRWQFREWLFSFFTVFLTALVFLFWIARSNPWFWAAMILLALLQAMLTLCISLAYVIFFRKIETRPAFLFCALIGILVFFPSQSVEWIRLLSIVLPAGWANALFEYCAKGSPERLLFLAAPVGMLAFTALLLAQRLKAGYPRFELTFILERTFAEEIAQNTNQQPAPLYGEDLEHPSADYLRSREQFAAIRNQALIESQHGAPLFDWQTAAWPVRLAARWMTPRERVIAYFLKAGHPNFSDKRWRFVAGFTALGVLFCLLSASLPFGLSAVPFIASALAGTPLFGGNWPSFVPAHVGFVNLPFTAVYPISFREASKAVAKMNSMLILTFAPVALIIGGALGWRWEGTMQGVGMGLIGSIQALFVLLVIQPYFVLFQHSRGTNDTKSVNLTSLAFLAALISNAACFLPAAIFFFAAPLSPLAWAICPASLALLSFIMWRFYEFLYDRGRIDLLASAR